MDGPVWIPFDISGFPGLILSGLISFFSSDLGFFCFSGICACVFIYALRRLIY